MTKSSFHIPPIAPLLVQRDGEFTYSPPRPGDSLYALDQETGTYVETGIVVDIIGACGGNAYYILPPRLPTGQSAFIPNGSTPTDSAIITRRVCDVDMVQVTVQFLDPEQRIVNVFGVNVWFIK
jgi:hypothetical protein